MRGSVSERVNLCDLHYNCSALCRKYSHHYQKETTAAALLLFLANRSVRDLITICSLPASENTAIYQKLLLSSLQHHHLTIVSGLQCVIDFTRQDYRLASYPRCNCRVLTDSNQQSKKVSSR